MNKAKGSGRLSQSGLVGRCAQANLSLHVGGGGRRHSPLQVQIHPWLQSRRPRCSDQSRAWDRLLVANVIAAIKWMFQLSRYGFAASSITICQTIQILLSGYPWCGHARRRRWRRRRTLLSLSILKSPSLSFFKRTLLNGICIFHIAHSTPHARQREDCQGH